MKFENLYNSNFKNIYDKNFMHYLKVYDKKEFHANIKHMFQKYYFFLKI